MIFDKIFANSNERYIKSIKPLIEKINGFEKETEKFSLDEIRVKTKDFKERIGKGENLDDLLPEAFALAREASKRTLKQRHFDCQLMGGIALHQGKIVEMKTGEGKTLVATLAVYLNALTEKGVHVVTVNDYLSRRDAVWMGQIYDSLGLSTSCLNHEQSFLYDPSYKKPDEEQDKARDELGSFKIVQNFLRPISRREAYLADITYGTNNEFGFDYLRDNLVYDLKDQSQRGYNFAIVDEVDSILIDEARTPLIISMPETALMSEKEWKEEQQRYYQIARIAEQLKKEVDYSIDEKQKTFEWTKEGQENFIKILGKDPWSENGPWSEKDFLDSQNLLKKIDNAIRKKEFFILDREYVVKNGEIIIVDEFTGRLMPGRRWSHGLHQAAEAKEYIQGKGNEVQPVSKTLASVTFQNYFRMYKKLAGMTGTALTSAEEFDKVYHLEAENIPTNLPLARKNLPDRIYRTEKGKFKAVVEEIKKRHSIGQPILIGTRSVEKNEYLGQILEREGIPHQILNAKHHEKEGEIIAQAGRLGAVTVATNMAGRGVDIILGGNPPNLDEAKKTKEAGGLHIIGTERHEARRIDNQLRGRAGRQGDPGSSQFFVSLDDDLMRIFGGDRLKSLMERLNIPEDQPIEAKLISNAIESAQSKIEGMNFDIRKHVLEYDDVMNKHRETIYRKRKEFLTASPQELKEKILKIVRDQGFSEKDYEVKEKEIGEENMRKIEKIASLRTLDSFWMDHIDSMEDLKDAVGLRAYGQQDPLVEYKTEGHQRFKNLLKIIESAIIQSILKAEIRKEPNQNTLRDNASSAAYFPKTKETPGRNDPCPCGSGKKYKRCHGV
ncbi:MAG: preprotein translocase subunit SecA [Candidatus Nealsonbacteria bacterium]|nr:preprotein translocase subunit SecA [Candidatus Nealsonbacteria bacterium]